MNRISMSDPESVERAVAVLRAGGVIVYPTDTAYGLGADATNTEAVEKIFTIKGRGEDKPVPVIVGDIDQAKRYVVFSQDAERLAQTYWPGALTIVLPTNNVDLAHILRGKTESGVRIPASDWCQKLTQKLGSPVTSTSANATGTPPEYSIEGVKMSLGQGSQSVDLWVDGEVLPQGPVSTIVRMVDQPLEIQREGAISGADIKKVLE